MANTIEVGTVSEPISQNYEPFSLLPDSELDTALAEIETQIPRRQGESFSIVDVLPATDPQAINVAGALLQSQVEVHYFQIEGHGKIAPAKLQEICQALAQQIEIFRTVFAFLDNKLMQVVLSKYSTDIPIVQSYVDLDSVTKRLKWQHKTQLFKLGSPLVETTVLMRPRKQMYRILFRISHAVFDRASLPLIWRTLQSLFDGTSLSDPLSTFSKYAYDLHSRITPESLTYWQQHLAGSTMPRLSPLRSSANQTPFAMSFCGPNTISKARTISNSITSAIAIKSAWALVLGAYLGTQDVVFGDTISGRHRAAHLDTVGCLATHVPLRIDLATQTTATDLLSNVQDILSTRLLHEALGFRQIWSKCTTWPTSTRFTSIVDHRRGMTGGIEMGGIEMGGTTHTITTLAPEDISMPNLFDIALVSEEFNDTINLSLGYSKDVFTRTQANLMLRAVCDVVRDFDERPETRVVDIMQSLAHTLPHPHPLVAAALLQHANPPLLSTTTATTTSTGTSTPTLPIDPDLESIWALAFTKTSKRGIPGAHFSTSPFWDLGGDLVDAVLVARCSEERGLSVKLDQVLELESLEGVAEGLMAGGARQP